MNLDRDGWLQAVGLDAGEVPAAIVLEGTWWHRERYPLRLAYLDEVRELDFPDMYWGRYRGTPVMFCCAYGAARAVEPVHAFGMMGTRVAIQIGSCGGIQPGPTTGDIMLPERVTIGEGASQYYGGKGQVSADPALIDEAERIFREREFTVHRGAHLTTSALFAQPPERVAGWRQRGHLAVDMETSAVFASAAHFGMRAVSLLFVWDELSLGRTFLDQYNPDELARQERANRVIFEVALELAEAA